MKNCKTCGKNKPEEDFYWAVKGKRRSYRCKSCLKKDVRERQQTKGSRAYENHKYHKKRAQAEARGIPFTLSFEEFLRIRKKKLCSYCGKPMPYKTIDRVDPSKGYTDDNVLISCFPCNRMKTDFCVEDIPILTKILKELKQRA